MGLKMHLQLLRLKFRGIHLLERCMEGKFRGDHLLERCMEGRATSINIALPSAGAVAVTLPVVILGHASQMDNGAHAPFAATSPATVVTGVTSVSLSLHLACRGSFYVITVKAGVSTCSAMLMIIMSEQGMRRGQLDAHGWPPNMCLLGESRFCHIALVCRGFVTIAKTDYRFIGAYKAVLCSKADWDRG